MNRAGLGLGAFLLAIPAVSGVAGAEPLVVERTSVHELRSERTEADYRISVSLPRGYDESDRRFPAVLLLDAHYSFLLARSITDHLSERSDLPEVVLVGVGYPGRTDRASDDYRRNRSRDYTPVRTAAGGYGPEFAAVSGGGPKFLEFLERELLPFLAARYRLTADRTLVGHSYGGLFALFAALERPTLFGRLLVVSPSLWHANHWIFEWERSRAPTDAGGSPRRMYLAVGSREVNTRTDMPADLRRWAAVMERRPGREWIVHSEVLEDETHNTVFPRALSNGLRFLLEGD